MAAKAAACGRGEVPKKQNPNRSRRASAAAADYPYPRDRFFVVLAERDNCLFQVSCVDPEIAIIFAPPRINSAAPMGGTSVEYLTRRLQQAGRTDLLEAIAHRRLSVYAAAEAAGFVTRRPARGIGSPNAAKRRQFQVRAILRETNGPPRRP